MTTLEQILELAKQARRSPHARRVLFDALIDRYGDDFLITVNNAQERADRDDRSLVIIFRPHRLHEADAAWREYLGSENAAHRLYRFLENWHVFSTIDIGFRRNWWTPPSEWDETVVVAVVHPQRRLAERWRRLT